MPFGSGGGFNGSFGTFGTSGYGGMSNFSADSGLGKGLQGFMPDLGPQMQQQGAAFDANAAKNKFGYDTSLLGQQLGGQRDIASMENAGATQRAQIAANASMFPAQVKQGEFNQLFPYITNSLSLLNPGKSQHIGGDPNITTGGVYNPQQIQQQVNASNASTNASTAAQNKQQESSLAGRGFGSNSPLAQMLASGNQMNALQTNTQNETGIRQNAAQQNAQQLLSSQNAYEQAVEARQKPYFQQQSALISLLGAFA